MESTEEVRPSGVASPAAAFHTALLSRSRRGEGTAAWVSSTWQSGERQGGGQQTEQGAAAAAAQTKVLGAVTEGDQECRRATPPGVCVPCSETRSLFLPTALLSPALGTPILVGSVTQNFHLLPDRHVSMVVLSIPKSGNDLDASLQLPSLRKRTASSNYWYSCKDPWTHPR